MKQNERPMGVVILSDDGERIATPACGLVRNDEEFCYAQHLLGCIDHRKITSLRASAHTGVAIRIPAMQSIALAAGQLATER